MPFIAVESFFGPDNRVIQSGAEVPDDDPVLEGREHLFVHTTQPTPKGVESWTADDDKPSPARRRRTRKTPQDAGTGAGR